MEPSPSTYDSLGTPGYYTALNPLPEVQLKPWGNARDILIVLIGGERCSGKGCETLEGTLGRG